MKLIIAHARYKGGLSGSDNIYLNFAKYWGDCEVWDMLDMDFRPFAVCYALRIVRGCWRALICRKKYDFVYSASDFMMDSLPAYILTLKGNKWVAGFYLLAPKRNKIYKMTQDFVRPIIEKYADVICVTNESMFDIFAGKMCIAVHGGVDLSKAKLTHNWKYDVVFVGRLHYTKGIDRLCKVWDKIRAKDLNLTLAVIGGGDSEEKQFYEWRKGKSDVAYFGFMGDDRYEIYKKSKVIVYTTPPEYTHFSMGPVEAMSCGCPMVAFEQGVMDYIKPKGTLLAKNDEHFADLILKILSNKLTFWNLREEAFQWARTWDWEHRAIKVLRSIEASL